MALLPMGEITTIGRYDILGELGRGAMGVVYKARDPKMDRIVAVKTIQGMALAGPQAQEYRDRFTREARAAGRLSHPGIVAVFDVGDHQGTPFLVMEYVEGRTLETALNARERFSFDRIEELGEQLAAALGYAHRNGVVHRDIKPANILLTAPDARTPERAKVTDLGIAKLSASQITTTGQLMGTPSYMPPEQFTGAPVDGRADIFSLGVILYWMATGDKPFAGDTITAVSYKIVHTETIPPRLLNPAVPEGLEIIILRCLEKDPARRYQSGEALAQDLATVRGGGTIAAPTARTSASESTTLGVGDPNMTLHARSVSPAAARPAVSGTDVTEVVTPATQSAAGAAKASAGPGAKKPNLALAGAGIGVLALILIGAFVMRNRTKPGESPVQGPVTSTSAQPSAAPPTADASSSQASADASNSTSAPGGTSADAAGSTPPPSTGQLPATKSGQASPTGSVGGGSRTGKIPPAKTQTPQNNRASSSAGTDATGAKNEPPKTDAALAKSSDSSAAAPQPSNPPPVTTPSQPSSPPKPAALNPNEAARLKLDFGRIPDNVGFIVLVDGKPIYQRADAASGASISDEPLVPPGQHEIRVLAAVGGVKLGPSNSVRDTFEARKRKTLRVELRDGATGKTLGKSAKVTDGSADFVISFKTGLF